MYLLSSSLMASENLLRVHTNTSLSAKIAFHFLTDTGQPDGDIFLRKPYKLGYVLAAIGKPVAAHEDNAVFEGQRVQKFPNDTG